MSIVKKNINSKFAPMLIPFFGFGFQGFLYIILLIFGLLTIGNENPNPLFLIASTIVFFMPIISLLGVFLSLRNIIKKEYIVLNILALSLNLVWLGLLFLAIWMVFVLKVTA
ncbi:hypothetical protein KHQ81_05475 [Mycoplasmatota bacterium]|nr:hypothetical protein KHQ81_05475 [Mycoplasmatota bacterium]